MRTYVDSGVLIAAARGKGRLYERALSIITDPVRQFVCSDYVRLEVLPKPKFFGFQAEVDFYEAYFARVAAWIQCDAEHLVEAFDEACRAGLSAMDAVHVVVARSSECGEFITTEKPTEAIHRSTLVRIVSIDD